MFDSQLADRLTIETCLDGAGQLRTMADEVRRGLTAPQKYLPCKYFYDARGSELFELITELPEYYQTRTELAMLESIADELASELRFGELVELGSGSAKKTRALLDAMQRAGSLARYIPFDVSEPSVRESASGLLDRYPTLSIYGVLGDFQNDLPHIPAAVDRRLVIFLGSTIGNLDGPERKAFLSEVRRLLRPEDRFLLGVDLVKDVATLEAAYNDAAGVTAEFNRNILRVVNNGLGADFKPDAYRHYAPYNVAEARIEMHLIPETPQVVHVRNLDLELPVAPDETIWTEISCKFTRQTTSAMLEGAGMRLSAWHIDPRQLFALALAEPDLR